MSRLAAQEHAAAVAHDNGAEAAQRENRNENPEPKGQGECVGIDLLMVGILDGWFQSHMKLVDVGNSVQVPALQKLSF